MKVLYLETSALLRILFTEEQFEKAAQKLREGDRVVTSRLTKVEAERGLIRLGIEKPQTRKIIPQLEQDLKHFWSRIDLFEITKLICDLAGQIALTSKIRSLDAIHLATFYYLKGLEPSIEMFSFDERIKAEIG